MIFSRLVAMLPDPLQIPAWKHRARKTSVGYDVEVFYDGDCPLCLREINMLRRKDSKGKIQFTNIADAEFHSLNVGKTYDELMLRIHGRLPDGTWIEGVEVFRRLYKAVGFGPLVAVTRLPIISQVMDLGYVLFARNRLRLTGRCQAGTCDIKSKTGTGE
ncbi:MAG: DUF393 domain-containing protein [Planctomycetota bacterium]